MELTYENTRTLGVVLVENFVKDGAIVSQRYFTSDDLECQLPEGKIVKITLEYVPFSECLPTENEDS